MRPIGWRAKMHLHYRPPWKLPFRWRNAGCRGRRRAFGTGARLRNHRFFSLAELNVAIRRLLDELNMRLMRGCQSASNIEQVPDPLYPRQSRETGRSR